MNHMLHPTDLAVLAGDWPVSSAMPSTILVGMPHLCLGALSETWLLTECGHRHWLLLATGLDVPDFRDEAGEPVYAMFLAVSVRDAAPDAVHEHDQLAFSSRLVRAAHTRFTMLPWHLGAYATGRRHRDDIDVRETHASAPQPFDCTSRRPRLAACHPRSTSRDLRRGNRGAPIEPLVRSPRTYSRGRGSDRAVCH